MMQRFSVVLLSVLLALSLFVPTVAATTPTPIDLLIISDSTGRGHVGGAGYSAWGGWRGRLINRLWATHDVRPIGRSSQPESAVWGTFEAIPNGTALAATNDLDNVFAALNGNPPEIVIIGLGINDGNALNWVVPTPSHAIAADMTGLVTGIATRAPNAEIYVCTIPILAWGADSTQWSGLYNAYLPIAAQNARLAGANVTVLDCVEGMWNPADPTDFWYFTHNEQGTIVDPVHPNEGGYIKMADNIEKGLRKHSALLGD